jgi:hypothetical protein
MFEWHLATRVGSISPDLRKTFQRFLTLQSFDTARKELPLADT